MSVESRLTNRMMTLHKWRRLRVKTFVRCEDCGCDLYPNNRYVEEITDETPPKVRNLCLSCGKAKMEAGG